MFSRARATVRVLFGQTGAHEIDPLQNPRRARSTLTSTSLKDRHRNRSEFSPFRKPPVEGPHELLRHLHPTCGPGRHTPWEMHSTPWKNRKKGTRALPLNFLPAPALPPARRAMDAPASSYSDDPRRVSTQVAHKLRPEISTLHRGRAIHHNLSPPSRTPS